MPALPFAARSEGADRDREAPGVRSSRAPAAGDGASGFGLPLRALPARDQGGVSRRRGLADAIWRALQGGGGLSERRHVALPRNRRAGSRPSRQPHAKQRGGRKNAKFQLDKKPHTSPAMTENGVIING